MSSYILIGPCVCENASIGLWTTERVLTPVSSLSSAAGSYDTTHYYLPQLSILHCYCTGRAVEANIDAPCSKCFWQSSYCNGCFNHLIVLVLYSIPYWSIINLQGCISFSLNSSWVNVNILCIKWRIKNQWNTFQICVSSNYFSSYFFFNKIFSYTL